MCEDIPECVEHLPGLNYEFDDNGYLIYEPQNCTICEPGFRGINHIPENTTVSDKKSCFYKSDIDGLQDIINLNSNLSGMKPLEIGHQTWDSGRITTLALIDANLLQTEGFEQHAEILCKVIKNGHKFYEVPISYNGRNASEGKKIKAYHFFLVLFEIIKRRFL